MVDIRVWESESKHDRIQPVAKATNLAAEESNSWETADGTVLLQA